MSVVLVRHLGRRHIAVARPITRHHALAGEPSPGIHLCERDASEERNEGEKHADAIRLRGDVKGRDSRESRRTASAR